MEEAVVSSPIAFNQRMADEEITGGYWINGMVGNHLVGDDGDALKR